MVFSQRGLVLMMKWKFMGESCDAKWHLGGWCSMGLPRWSNDSVTCSTRLIVWFMGLVAKSARPTVSIGPCGEFLCGASMGSILLSSHKIFCDLWWLYSFKKKVFKG